MRVAGTVLATIAWAALIVLELRQLNWPLLAACVVAALLIGYAARSWWPMLAPIGVWAAVLAYVAIWPTDGAECACEPFPLAGYLWGGVFAVGILAFCYGAGWSLRRAREHNHGHAV
jgi:hypothetical protein